MTRLAILIADHHSPRHGTIEAAIRRLRPDITIHHAMLAGDTVITADALKADGQHLLGVFIHSTIGFSPVSPGDDSRPMQYFCHGAIATAQMLRHTVGIPVGLIVGLAFDDIAEGRLDHSKLFGQIVFDEMFGADPEVSDSVLEPLLGRLAAAWAAHETTAAAVT